VDESAILEQCGDWTFIAELLTDVMNEKAQFIADARQAIAANDHNALRYVGYRLRGAAMNMALTAMVGLCRKIEALACALRDGSDEVKRDVRLSGMRESLVLALEAEYDRLEAFRSIAEERAEAEQAAQSYVDELDEANANLLDANANMGDEGQAPYNGSRGRAAHAA